jgi:hypothetical protein
MSEKTKAFIRENQKNLITASVILLIGIIYFIIIQLTEFRIPCVFQKLPGLACPGCGITSMINGLAHFNFKTAISENYVISAMIPIYATVYGVRLIFKPRCLQNSGWLFNTIVSVTLIALIVFGIVRNLPGMEFLLPTYMR